MNTNTQTVDERCANIARCAIEDARYLYFRNLMPNESPDDLKLMIIARADHIIALRTAEAAQHVEVARQAGVMGWCCFPGPNFYWDCDVPVGCTEDEAIELARAEYPDRTIYAVDSERTFPAHEVQS